MNHYSRRSFIKRAGSASLGTALGLGLIPSITNKLKATDTSTLDQGVVFHFLYDAHGAITSRIISSTYGGHTIEAGVEFLNRPTAGVCSASIDVRWRRWYSFSVTTQTTQTHTTPPPLSEQVTTTTTNTTTSANVTTTTKTTTKTTDTETTTTTTITTSTHHDWTVTWSCINGVPNAVRQNDMSAPALTNLTYPAVAPNAPGVLAEHHDTTTNGGDETVNGLGVAVFDGFNPTPLSNPVSTPLLSHTVVCCPLAA